MLDRGILGAGVISAGIAGSALGFAFSTDFLGVLATAVGGTATMLAGVWMVGSAASSGQEVAGDV